MISRERKKRESEREGFLSHLGGEDPFFIFLLNVAALERNITMLEHYQDPKSCFFGHGFTLECKPSTRGQCPRSKYASNNSLA